VVFLLYFLGGFFMAYKFQLGGATMSGSLTQEGAIVCDTSLTIGNAAMSEADLEKLDGITNGVVAANKAVVVDGNKDAGDFRHILMAGKVGTAPDQEYVDFGTSNEIKFGINNTVEMTVAAAGLSVTNGITVGAGENIDAAGAGNVSLYASAGANNLTLGGSTSTVVVPGNLTIQGTTTTVDSTTIHVSSSITFEGPVDAHETTIEAGVPTTDITVLLPEYSSSANVVKMALLADGGSSAEYSAAAAVTAVEFALLDGGSTVGTTALASGDGFLHNDNGTMKQTSINKLADFFAGDGIASSGGVLAVGVDDSSIELNSDALRVKALGVTNAMLAGSIANGKLANSTISGISLGSNLNALSLTANSGLGMSANYNGSAAVTFGLSLDGLAAAAVNVGADSIAIYDADADITGKETIADLMTAVAGDGLAASSGVLAIQVSGAVKLASDKVGLSGSLAGDGLSFTGGLNSISSLVVDADPDSFSVSALGLQLAANVAGAGLALSSGALSVGVDDSSIEINSDSLRVKAGGISNAMLADDAVGADELASNAVVNASIAANAAIDIDKLDGGSCASSLTDLAQGDLLYAGDISDSNGIKSITFSNLEDAIFGNISGDATIAAGGALTIAAGAIEEGMLNDNIISGQAELAAGGVADADELLISDGGTLKRIGVDSFAAYTQQLVRNAIGDANGTLVAGVNYASANTSAARTWTLPASPALGDSVKVKAAGLSGGAITIARAGSQTIDGSNTSIVLESDNAAVELIYVAADDWRVF
jgi:hypothetical protein